MLFDYQLHALLEAASFVTGIAVGWWARAIGSAYRRGRADSLTADPARVPSSR